MAKLVRRKSKLLRKGGKLTRSAIDLNPAPPCECCLPPPPPPPQLWVCDRVTGVCSLQANAGGYATQAECQAACQIGCPTFCYFDIDQRGGVCLTGTYVKSYLSGVGVTMCRIYYPTMSLTMAGTDPADSCRLGSQEMATYIGGGMTRSQTLTYKSGTAVNGIACGDGRCYPNDVVFGGCPAQVFP